MQYALIVDFEATCNNDNSFPRETMEIIEIGAIVVDDKFEIVSEFQCFVKPMKHRQLTPFCMELTTIKQTDVDSAEPFEIVIPKFLDWVDEAVGDNHYDFYSWGMFDKNILKRQVDELIPEESGDYIFDVHINAKREFAKHNKLKREMGVGSALRFKKMQFEGTPHRALDDTRNILKLIKTFKG